MDEVVFRAFTRRLTSKPAIVYDKKDGHAMLAKHVIDALENVKDRSAALTQVIRYLDQKELDLRTAYPWNSWEITQKNPQQNGTLAQLEFLRKQVSKIKSVIDLEVLSTVGK